MPEGDSLHRAARRLQVLVGERSLGHFPDWFVGIDYRYLFGVIPLPLVIFLTAACVFAILLHRTIFGRCIYAIGTNESASPWWISFGR